MIRLKLTIEDDSGDTLEKTQAIHDTELVNTGYVVQLVAVRIHEMAGDMVEELEKRWKP